MKLRLNRIAAGDTHHELRWQPGALPRLAEELAAREGVVAASLDLRMDGELVEVTGSLHAELVVPCTRCLAPTALELNEEFRAVQAPLGWQDRLGDEVRLEGQELDMDFFEGDAIDLTALVEEQVLLNLPESHVCRDDCRGICAGCGRNLNESACVCEPDRGAHPFAGLKSLLSESPGRR
jgi:uncharacterized protein